MIDKNVNSRSMKILLVLTIVIVALNLRPSMAAIGPLLEFIKSTITLSYNQAPLLTVLPIVAIGLGMLMSDVIYKHIGVREGVLISLAVIGLSSLMRACFANAPVLIISTVIAGLGIAVVQVLIPAFIKRYFNNVPLMTGIYATSIMGGATLATSLAPWMANRMPGWQYTFIPWVGLSIVGMIVWVVCYAQLKKIAADAGQDITEKPMVIQDKLFSNKRAWLLAIFFGLGTSGYTCILAWLAPYYEDLGYSAETAGLLVALLTVLEIVSGLLFPYLASKRRDRRPFLILLLLIAAVGYIGLALTPTKPLFLWIILLGIGVGGLFPMSLIIPLDHIESPERSGNLNSFAQGFGYIFAAGLPIFAGFLRTQLNNFTICWIILVGVMLIMIPLALKFNPKHYHRYFP